MPIAFLHIHALILVIITGRSAQERFQGIDPTGLLSEFHQPGDVGGRLIRRLIVINQRHRHFTRPYRMLDHGSKPLDAVNHGMHEAVEEPGSKFSILQGKLNVRPDLTRFRIVVKPQHFVPHLDRGDRLEHGSFVLAAVDIPRLRGKQGHELAVLEHRDHHLQAGIAISVTVGRFVGFAGEGDGDCRFLFVLYVLQFEFVQEAFDLVD
jgi:hypothetical protein